MDIGGEQAKMRIEKMQQKVKYFYIRKIFILIFYQYMHKDSKAHSIKNKNKNAVIIKENFASIK